MYLAGKTTNDTKLSTVRFAMEVRPLVNDRKTCEAFIRTKKQAVHKITDSVCFNVYLSTENWFYIPDFVIPDNYEIEKRAWYTGALLNQGEPFVTDPYLDAMTGDICFSVSVLLPDKPGQLAEVSKTIAEVQGNVIKLEHNQFVSTNRNEAVELRITLEAFGKEHKGQIMEALDKGGYKPKIVRTSL